MLTEPLNKGVFIFRKMARPDKKGLWYFKLYFASHNNCLNDREAWMSWRTTGNYFIGLRHAFEYYKAAPEINRQRFCYKVETYSLKKISYDVVTEPDMKWALLNRKNKIKKYMLLAEILIEGKYYINR